VLAARVATTLAFALRRSRSRCSLAGSVPSTVTNKEWAPATQQRGLAQPREGSAVPIETNPIKHRKA